MRGVIEMSEGNPPVFLRLRFEGWKYDHYYSKVLEHSIERTLREMQDAQLIGKGSI